MKNILFISIIILTNTACQHKETHQKVKQEQLSIDFNTTLDRSKIESLVNQIKQSIANGQLQKYDHPNMTYCGGATGFYEKDELKCIKTKHHAELGFSTIDAYFYKNEIIQLVKYDHHAIWEKYNEAIVDGVFIEEKMPYTDTLTTSSLGKEFQTLKIWETDSTYIQVNQDFLSQQLECIILAIKSLSIEKILN